MHSALPRFALICTLLGTAVMCLPAVVSGQTEATPDEAVERARSERLRAQAIWEETQDSSPEAIEIATRAVELAVAARHAEEEGRSLFLLGVFQDVGGDPETAVGTLERGYEILKAELGLDDIDTARCGNSLGKVRSTLQRGPEAMAVLEEVRPTLDANEADHPRALLSTLRNTADVQRRHLGDLNAAMATLQTAVDLCERRLPDDPGSQATALRLLSRIQVDNGYPDEALASIERAVELGREAFGERSVDWGQVLQAQGHVYWKRGDLARAREIFEQCLDLRQEILPPSHFNVLETMNSLAIIRRDLNDLDGARRIYEEILLIQESEGRTEARSYATTVSNLAILLANMGELDAAQRRFEQALELDRARLGPEHPIVGQDMLNLGAIAQMAGDRKTAASALAGAAESLTKSLGPDHPVVGIAEGNLATVYTTLNRQAEAAPLFEQAIPKLEAGLGPKSPDLATFYNMHARLLAEIDELDAADGRIEQALAIHRDVLGDSHPSVGLDLHNRGRLRVQQGRLDEALAAMQESRAVLEGGRTPDHPELARLRMDLARLHLLRGEFDDALAQATTAERSGRDHFRTVARGQPERDALRFAAVRPTGLDAAIAAALELGTEAARGAAWDELVRSRALVLDEMALRNAAILRSEDEKTAALARSLAEVRGELATLIVRGPQAESAADHATRVAAVSARKRSIEQELAERSRSYARLRQREEAGIDEVLDALPAGTALVAYYRVSLESEAPRMVALVGTPEGKIELVALGESETIDAAIEAWRETFDPAAMRGPLAARAERECRRTGAAVRELIWDPLPAAARGAESVFLVPSGSLHLVSPAALPVGDVAYLVEAGPTVQVLSVERDLVADDASEPGKASLLAVGDPDFDLSPGADGDTGMMVASATFRGATSVCTGFADLSFDPLPGAREETRRVAERGRARFGRNAVEVLAGAQATEAAVKTASTEATHLHMATHGYFLGGDCATVDATAAAASWDLASDSGPALSTEQENPLLLSGLALAAANQRREQGRSGEDGILTAEEIAALDLSGVQTVVLSACETGRGEVVRGEGVLGLRRAFRQAGVRSMITSLWRVDDDAARAWMDSFYRARFDEESSVPVAARTASRELLEELRSRGRSTHPMLWAAFVPSGDWR